MSDKTPLHATPSRHAFRAYLLRCLTSSFPEEPRATWHEGYSLPALPNPPDYSGMDWQEIETIGQERCAYPACHKLCGTDGPCDDPWLA